MTIRHAATWVPDKGAKIKPNKNRMENKKFDETAANVPCIVVVIDFTRSPPYGSVSLVRVTDNLTNQLANQLANREQLSLELYKI